MAASRTTLLLLGLVALATLCAAAEATKPKPKPAVVDVGVKVALTVDLQQCKPGVKVLVALQAAVDVGKAKAVACVGGEVTALPLLVVHANAGHLITVDLHVLAHPKPLKAVLVLDLAKVAKVDSKGVHHVALVVVEDLKLNALLVLCARVRVKLLSLLGVRLGVGLGLGLHL